MRPTVYIPHLPTRKNPVDGAWVPTISLNPAADLGDLKVLCNHPSDSAPENFHLASEYLQEELTDITADDYILMAGDPVLCAFAIHTALMTCLKARILRWNREARTYDYIVIDRRT